MMKYFLIALFVFCGSQTALAEGWRYEGEVLFSVKNLPRFDEFADGIRSPKKTAEDINWGSDKGAWRFRTRLRKALKQGPNFAGKYIVVSIGCGTSCQGNWILDAETGDVVGGFSSSEGAEYKLDSRLLIKHFPRNEILDYEHTNWGGYGGITYYEFLSEEDAVDNDRLYELLTLRPPIIEWDNPKYPKYKGYP